jgi:hypothetical protein
MTQLLNLINLISITENDAGSVLLQLEKDFLALDEKQKFSKEKQPTPGEAPILEINNRQFEKIILTPLLMDFGHSGSEQIEHIFYKEMPKKPISEQILDTYYGIKNYLKKSEFQIFEIFPFLGINPKLYSLGFVIDDPEGKLKDPVEDFKAKFGKIDYIVNNCKVLIYEKLSLAEITAWLKLITNKVDSTRKEEIHKDLLKYQKENDYSNNLIQLLSTYFEEYTGDYNDFHNHFQKHFIKKSIDGNPSKIGSFFFSGIKLYPPLGFDPWPEEDELELSKVNYLYQFCHDKQIPITIHTGYNGFVTSPKARQFTNPKVWEKILPHYKNLKINFAHFGIKETIGRFKKSPWTKTILNYILDPEYKNIYTDFACKGVDPSLYDTLSLWLDDLEENDRTKLEKRILFGTDFQANLFKIDSYKKYISLFFGAVKKFSLTQDREILFSSTNPKEFLFKK